MQGIVGAGSILTLANIELGSRPVNPDAGSGSAGACKCAAKAGSCASAGIDPAAPAGRTDPVSGDVRLLISQHDGKPIAVLLALKEYERLREGRRSFTEAYREFLRRNPDFAANAVEPEDWLHEVRDPSPGRDFTW